MIEYSDDRQHDDQLHDDRLHDDRPGDDRQHGESAASDPGAAGRDEIDRVLPAMRGLRMRAQVTNLARAEQLDLALERAATSRLDEAGRAQAVAVAHQLIGSAGTFGFAEASRRAADLKDFFAAGKVTSEDVQTARIGLGALRRDLHDGRPAPEL